MHLAGECIDPRSAQDDSQQSALSIYTVTQIAETHLT